MSISNFCMVVFFGAFALGHLLGDSAVLELIQVFAAVGAAISLALHK